MGKQAKRKALRRQLKKELSTVSEEVIVDLPVQEIVSDEEKKGLTELILQDEVSKEKQSINEQSQIISELIEVPEVIDATNIFTVESNGNLQEAQKDKYTRYDVFEATLRQTLKQHPNHPSRLPILQSLCSHLEKRGLLPQAIVVSNYIVQLSPNENQHRATNERLKKLIEQNGETLDTAAEEERLRALEQIAEGEHLKSEKHQEKEKHLEQTAVISGVEEILPLVPDKLYQGEFAKRKLAFSSLATKIISGNGTKIAKPLFNSQGEYVVYKILLELFPNYLVYPNMALHTLFYFDAMKQHLNGEEFEYFLKSHVDFCITRISDYFPLVAFEVDSNHHDTDEATKRDEIKNRIFSYGGIDLLRVRPYGQITEEGMRQEIGMLIQEWNCLL